MMEQVIIFYEVYLGGEAADQRPSPPPFNPGGGFYGD